MIISLLIPAFFLSTHTRFFPTHFSTIITTITGNHGKGGEERALKRRKGNSRHDRPARTDCQFYPSALSLFLFLSRGACNHHTTTTKRPAQLQTYLFPLDSCLLYPCLPHRRANGSPTTLHTLRTHPQPPALFQTLPLPPSRTTPTKRIVA